MKRTASLLVLALVSLTGSGPAAALPAADIYAKIAPSVWRVQTLDEDGLPLRLGSAVVVAPEVLATNCDVLAHAHRVVVKHEKRSLDAKLTMWDPARDVCELRTIGIGAPAVVLAKVSTLRVGQPVYTLGSPSGLDLTMSAGLLSAIRRNDKQQIVLLQTSAPVSLGSGGGGLFDDRGRLIGLTTLMTTAVLPNRVQSLNFAVPVEWITQLPQRFARLKAVARASGSDALATAEVASAATPDTAPSEPGVPAFQPPAEGAIEDVAKLAPPHAAASLADDSHLPHASEKMREAYRRFLEQYSPRAFAVGENGSWWAVWNVTDPAAARAVVVDPGQRALLNCQRHSVTRCHLYAVDDRVVDDASIR